MSTHPRQTTRRITAVNDNGPGGRRVVLRFDPDMPITQAEVEIFDALISNLDDLIANDNDPPGGENDA